MSLLGIDYGDKKIGLAKSANTLAVPLKILENKGDSFVLGEIEKICKDENISEIVVGVPLSLSQKGIRDVDFQNSQMKKVLVFIKLLKSNLHYPIAMEDERMSTKMANTMAKGLKKGEKDDAVAAMLILQSYLDRKNV